MALTCNPLVDDDCGLGDAIVGNVASKALEAWAKAASDAAASVIKMVVSGWVYVPSGTVTDPATDKTGAVAHLQGHTYWIVAALMVAGLLFAGIRMALQPDGREAGQLARNIGIMVVLAGLGIPVMKLLVEIGDSYSTWIIDKSADGDFGGRMGLIAAAAAKGFPGVHLMILILGVVVALSGVIQLLMLIGRAAALVLMAGLLPVVAAGALTGRTGAETRNRYLSWTLAIILYKPAAATVYAAAFWAIGKGDKPMDLFIALALFIMAMFALPALMRLIAPAVSAVSSSGSGGLGMAMAGGAGSLATGAMQLGGGGTSSSGAGASGMDNAIGAGAVPAGRGTDGPTQSNTAPGTSSTGGGAGRASGAAAQTSGSASSAASGAGAGASAGVASAGGGAAAGAAGGPVGAGVMVAAGVAKAGVGVVRQASSAVADGATGASDQGSGR